MESKNRNMEDKDLLSPVDDPMETGVSKAAGGYGRETGQQKSDSSENSVQEAPESKPESSLSGDLPEQDEKSSEQQELNTDSKEAVSTDEKEFEFRNRSWLKSDPDYAFNTGKLRFEPHEADRESAAQKETGKEEKIIPSSENGLQKNFSQKAAEISEKIQSAFLDLKTKTLSLLPDRSESPAADAADNSSEEKRKTGSHSDQTETALSRSSRKAAEKSADKTVSEKEKQIQPLDKTGRIKAADQTAQLSQTAKSERTGRQPVQPGLSSTQKLQKTGRFVLNTQFENESGHVFRLRKGRLITVGCVLIAAAAGGVLFYESANPIRLRSDSPSIELGSSFDPRGNIRHVFMGSADDVTISGLVNGLIPGTYEVDYRYKGETKSIQVRVADTTAPELKLKDITVGMSEEVDADSFVESCTDASRYSLSIDNPSALVEATGTRQVQITAIDEYGNSVTRTASLTRTNDSIPPIAASTPKERSFNAGDDFEPQTFEFTEGSADDFRIEVSTGDLDMNTPGVYSVTYKFWDQNNHQTSFTETITVTGTESAQSDSADEQPETVPEE